MKRRLDARARCPYDVRVTNQGWHSRTRTKRNAMAAALGVTLDELPGAMWSLRRSPPFGEGLKFPEIQERLIAGPIKEPTAKSTLCVYFQEVRDPKAPQQPAA